MAAVMAMLSRIRAAVQGGFQGGDSREDFKEQLGFPFSYFRQSRRIAFYLASL
jgi:hypothetical protein